MRRLALQGPVRRLLTRLHRWSGLILLVLLFVAGATGGILAFRDDIERWVNPHLHVVRPEGRRAPLQEVIDRVERRFTAARVSTITLQRQPDDSLIVYMNARPGSDPGESLPSQAFVNPYSAEILGQRNRRQPVFSRENLVPMLIRLHHSLLLDTPGVWLMGGAAIVWLLTTAIGVALAWPTAWRRLTGWWPIVSVRTADGPYKLNYDLHRAIGVVLLPIWLVLAFTSVYLNFPGLVRGATATVTTISRPPSRPTTAHGSPAVTPDDAIARAVAAVPGSTAFGFTRDFGNGWYSVRLIAPDDINPTGNSQAYIDFSTGAVEALRLAAAGSAGERFIAWQFPLHSGAAFGLAGRLAVAASAVALVVMCATGLYVWWRGWTARRRERARTRLASALRILHPDSNLRERNARSLQPAKD